MFEMSFLSSYKEFEITADSVTIMNKIYSGPYEIHHRKTMSHHD